MLLDSYNVSDQLYNPIIHLTQDELMEKFNLAFYETQNLSKNDLSTVLDQEIYVTSSQHQQEEEPISDDHLIDYLIGNQSSPSAATTTTPSIDVDFNDYSGGGDGGNNNQSLLLDDDGDFLEFYVPPPPLLLNNLNNSNKEVISSEFDLSDIDLCESLSNSSFDFDSLELYSLGDDCERALPPIATIARNNVVDFNNFLRNLPSDNLGYCNNDQSSSHQDNKNEYGHLIGIQKNYNNNQIIDETTFYHQYDNESMNNQLITTQNEALLNDDPLLSSSSLMYNTKSMVANENLLLIDDEEGSGGGGDSQQQQQQTIIIGNSLQCKWENCYQIYDCQTALVKHIEKCHVELKRGDEFTCFWANCPRKIKPFNARYKLLIHMRVHSGEKPNKCTFKGCNKAFSRLENLKIHQRSHTGERPYLCQFSSCTKSFSNSSDRAKHQRTHFDTKPYACQVTGCMKKYTDPSSLRKHVKNHTYEEQMLIKKRVANSVVPISISTSTVDCLNNYSRKLLLDSNKQKAVNNNKFTTEKTISNVFYSNLDHNYSNLIEKKLDSTNIRQDLKNKISEKNKLRKLIY